MPGAESISRRTFDNALRRLKPCRKPIGTRLLPICGYGSEPPFVALALETEPAIAVLARDSDRPSECAFAPLGSSSAIREFRVRLDPDRRSAPVDLPSLCRGGSHQPHFPSLALLVEKGPITHAERSSPSLFRAKVWRHGF